MGPTVQNSIIELGTEGQALGSGAKVLNSTTKWLGRGFGAYNACNTLEDYRAGQIGDVRFIADQGSNVLSTLGGLPGAAWGIGWEGGRAITNSQGYQDWKSKTWLPFRREVLGY